MYGVFGTSSVISAMSSATLYVNFSSYQCSVSVARFRDFAAHHGDEAPDDVAVLPERVEVVGAQNHVDARADAGLVVFDGKFHAPVAEPLLPHLQNAKVELRPLCGHHGMRLARPNLCSVFPVKWPTSRECK